MLTAILPVRSGSSRCKNKNTRKFGDSSLLFQKLQLLKEVNGIDYIIISTSDETITEMLKDLQDSKLSIHKRDPYFSQTNTSGSDLFNCLAETVTTPHMMYVTCVTPFVTRETYEKAIGLYYKNLQNTEPLHDSVISCKSIKTFLWKDGQPLNYDANNAPPSQNLPDIFNPTFAFNIIPTEFVRNNRSVIGHRPYFYELDEIEGIDIDTPYDFVVSQLLLDQGLHTITEINRFVNKE